MPQNSGAGLAPGGCRPQNHDCQRPPCSIHVQRLRAGLAPGLPSNSRQAGPVSSETAPNTAHAGRCPCIPHSGPVRGSRPPQADASRTVCRPARDAARSGLNAMTSGLVSLAQQRVSDAATVIPRTVTHARRLWGVNVNSLHYADSEPLLTGHGKQNSQDQAHISRCCNTQEPNITTNNSERGG